MTPAPVGIAQKAATGPRRPPGEDRNDGADLPDDQQQDAGPKQQAHAAQGRPRTQEGRGDRRQRDHDSDRVGDRQRLGRATAAGPPGVVGLSRLLPVQSAEITQSVARIKISMSFLRQVRSPH